MRKLNWIPPVMKSKEYIFLSNQDKHSNLAFEVRLSCHVTLNPPILTAQAAL